MTPITITLQRSTDLIAWLVQNKPRWLLPMVEWEATHVIGNRREMWCHAELAALQGRPFFVS